MRGFRCPKPAIETRRQLKMMSSGQILYVIASDPASEPDIKALTQRSGDSIIDHSAESGEFHYWIEKR